jgi:hypothetical protein
MSKFTLRKKLKVKKHKHSKRTKRTKLNKRTKRKIGRKIKGGLGKPEKQTGFSKQDEILEFFMVTDEINESITEVLKEDFSTSKKRELLFKIIKILNTIQTNLLTINETILPNITSISIHKTLNNYINEASKNIDALSEPLSELIQKNSYEDLSEFSKQIKYRLKSSKTYLDLCIEMVQESIKNKNKNTNTNGGKKYKRIHKTIKNIMKFNKKI